MKKSIWMNGVNLRGIWSERPIRGYWYESTEEWYDDGGNLSVEKLGVVVKEGIITFSSKNRKEVVLWTMGANAVLIQMREFCK